MTIVLGGGISGLSAAYYLLKQSKVSHAPKLFEASHRFGGWIKTDVSSNDRRVRFECGPRTIRPKGVKGLNTLQLCSELGLNNDVLPIKSSHPAAKNRMLVVNNELCMLPSTLAGAFKTLPPFTRPLIYGFYHDFRHKYTDKPLMDDTIYNFTERRFGKEIADYLISSMICGICAGDAKEISVKFLLKDLFDYEQKHQSVLMGIYNKSLERILQKNVATSPTNSEPIQNCELVKQSITQKWSIYSMNDGLEKLPKTLSDHLKSNGVELNTNAKCENIEFGTNGANVTINGKSYETDQLVSSLPAFELGKLVKKQHPQLADELLAIPYVDVAVINLQYSGNKNLLKTPAFGFLVPPAQNLPILGVLFDSCCFDMGENTVLTVMMGGKWFHERFGNGNEQDLYEKAIEQIQRILKIDQRPDAFKVHILRQCIPQYIVGHFDRIDRIMRYIEQNKLPLKVCGTAYDGVGVNDAIYSAKMAIDSIKK
ncbi:protoporphyrinogen oxidase [Contarinia nasturtii]|uniref:protoporphyrinogen oxidase n=1 Tax=Contarinia nasturtii TaxID=265458 RepID=UPI0012D49FE2|nr:protoporphyrinogen oxidase [Contarinia nasturtii]